MDRWPWNSGGRAASTRFKSLSTYILSSGAKPGLPQRTNTGKVYDFKALQPQKAPPCSQDSIPFNASLEEALT